MSDLLLNATTNPGTPASGKERYYTSSVDKQLWTTTDAGATYPVGSKPKDIEGEVYIDTANTQGWAGSDFGAWFNSAYAYGIATYGSTSVVKIKIGPGNFSYSTPAIMGTQFFSGMVEGSGDGSSGGGGTVLNFTKAGRSTSADGATNTNTTITSASANFTSADIGSVIIGSVDFAVNTIITAVTNSTTATISVAASGTHTNQTFTIQPVALAVSGAGGNNGGVQVRDLAINGTGITNNAIGLMFGTATASTSELAISNVAINNFQIGENWGVFKIAYSVQQFNVKIQACTIGARPYGEGNGFFGGLIGGCTTGIDASNAGTDLNAFGLAFDDNTTVAINMSNSLFRMTLSGCRFENAGAGTDLYITQTAGSLVILGGTIQSDLQSGTSTGFGNISGGDFTVRDTWLLGQGSRTFTQAFNVSGTAIVRITPKISQSSVGITTICQSGFTDQGRIFTLTSNVVSSGTTDFALFSGVLPANTLVVGSQLRVRFGGISSSTGTLIFKLHMGTAGTIADATAWTSVTSAAQVANQHAFGDIQATIRTVGGSGTAVAEGFYVDQTLGGSTAAAAQVTTTVATNSIQKVTLSVTCSVGTFTAQTGSIEIF